MPRRRRMYLPGVPAHLVQRGHNRQACFEGETDFLTYLDWLARISRRYGVRVHAWCLMTNHVHLLITPPESAAIPRMMRDLGSGYVTYFNRTHHRSGTLWEGRSKASLVQSARYLLTAYRYIELNPVRAGMVRSPGQYRWSSYSANALGQEDGIVSPHPEYLALGVDPEGRQSAYRALVAEGVRRREMERIRRACRFDMPYGGDTFRETVEKLLGRRIGYDAYGRPRVGNLAKEKSL